MNFFKKSKTTSIAFALVAIGFMLSTPIIANAVIPDEIPNEGLLPELRAIVPTHLQIQNQQQADILRFTNGIANIGPGHFQNAPDFSGSTGDNVIANQEILDADGNIVYSTPVSSFDFHAGHNHWHIVDVVEFSVHKDSPDGELVGESQKVTFCIEDVFKIDDNSNTAERIYWDCTVSLQGIQAGWADQYHQATEGNQIDITSAEAGTYYLVHHVNPDGIFLEVDDTNNVAWTEFELTRPTTGNSQGNAKIEITGHSECDGPALCGETTLNRG
jgi:hypothetical protein